MGISDAQAVVLGNKVYVGGGHTLTSEYCLYVSDVTMHTWKTLKSPIRRSALTTYQGRLVLVGGQNSFTDTPINQLWVMEEEGTWTQPIPPMPTPRWGASAASIQNNLIVAGGGGSQEKALDVVEVYNGRQWATAQSLPSAQFDMKSAIHNGNWYLAGVRTPGWREVFYALLESLIASTQSEVTERVWKNLPEVNYIASSTAVWGGRLMAVGGAGPSSKIVSYSPHTQSWVKVGDLPVGLSCTCTTVLPTGELLVIGGWPWGAGSPSDCVFKGSLRGES